MPVAEVTEVDAAMARPEAAAAVTVPVGWATANDALPTAAAEPPFTLAQAATE